MGIPLISAVERFAEELLDDERTTFTYEEADAFARSLGYSVATLVIRELKSYGFTQVERQPARRVRGITTSSLDRWYGPGSARTHGGSGCDQICGWAGQEG